MNVDEIFESQQRRSLILRAEGYKERRKRLATLEHWILTHKPAIREALDKDLLKSSQETDITEIYTVLTELREAKRNLKRWMEKSYAGSSLTYLSTTGYTYYEPKGVCLIISPWNYPFNLAVGPMVSAIAAGNTFILKPSEFTPHVSNLLSEMANKLFEKELGYVIEGDAEVAEQLLKLPFDHVFFTGSSAVGKLVMKAAAEHLSSVTLELGGKSPTIVDPSADLQDAAQKTAWGKWLNAGQTCVAPDYLFVHEKIYAQFARLLKEEAQTRFPESTYTGIIHDKHQQRLKELVRDAEDLGAVKTQAKSSDSDSKMSPVILEEVSEEMKVMKEEIFGPVLPIQKYHDLGEVIKYINNRPKPLSLYFFSRDKSAQKNILKQTSSGNLVINDCVIQFSHPELSFGGVSQSGFGKSHGKAGFHAFSNEKSVLKQRIGFTTAKLLYPPYNKWKNRIIDLLLKYF